MKLSSKDILLLFGVIVAIVVTLTTIAYSDEQSTYLPKMESPARKAGLNDKTNDFLKRSMQRVTGYSDRSY